MTSPKTICVAVVGVGLVGGEFVEQLTALASPHPFRIVSLSSSKITVQSPSDGGQCPWPGWRQDLLQSTTKPDLTALGIYLTSLIQAGVRDVVLVDNTSSEEVASAYPAMLRSGINIITPNKKAFSSSLALYDEIVSAGFRRGARFLNEATVGAGLPIISTLKDLIATGDKVMLLFFLCMRLDLVLIFSLGYVFF
jgi:homoserine dehydrogenase